MPAFPFSRHTVLLTCLGIVIFLKLAVAHSWNGTSWLFLPLQTVNAMRCSYWPQILQSHGYGCSFYEYTFGITFSQAFTRIWLWAMFVVTLGFLGNTPAFCSCCISIASDEFSSAVGVPLGGQRSLLAQQTCSVAASGSCTYAGLSWCAIAICRISQITLCSEFSHILSSKVLLQVFNSVTY